MLNSLKKIKPSKLANGDTIGLITPAGPINENQLSYTKKQLKSLGFKTYHTDRVFFKKGYLAGSDDDRIADIHEMFTNKNVKAILCIRGGYGTPRILNKLDYDLIRNNPKIFIGYSDITALLQAIYKFAGLHTFHGVVGISDFTEYTKSNFLQILTNSVKTQEISTILPENNPEKEFTPYIIRSGIAKGKLVGGNLALITSLMGTPYEIDFQDKLLFIEDIDEAPYKIDRMLTQLLLSDKFENVKGIILGVFNNCSFNNNDINDENSLSLKEVLIDRLSELGIPVIYGFSFGHIADQAIFPIGIMAELNTETKTITLLEKSVL